MDFSQVLNAFGVLSMWHLPLHAKNEWLAISIFGMMSFSFMYHMSLALGGLEDTTAPMLFIGDCVFQALSIYAIAMSSEYYDPVVKNTMHRLTWLMLCVIAWLSSSGLSSVLIKKKSGILVATIIPHIANAVIGGAWACADHGAAAYKRSMIALGVIATCFALDGLGVPYAWACGHCFCGQYVYYNWLANGLVRHSSAAFGWSVRGV